MDTLAICLEIVDWVYWVTGASIQFILDSEFLYQLDCRWVL